MYTVGVFFSLLVFSRAHAAPPAALGKGLPPCAAITTDTITVVDGNILKRRDRRLVVLAGMEAPFAPTWSTAKVDASRHALAQLLPHGKARFVYLTPDTDRYGRCLAKVYNQRGQWVQKHLVGQGMAYVYPVYAEDADIARLYKAEAAARTHGRGLWGMRPVPMLFRPETVRRALNQFQVVEGVVRKSKILGRNAYLDFGDTFWNDFSILLPWPVVQELRKEGVEIETLPGRQVQIRGYAFERRGGTIIANRRAALRLDPPVDRWLREGASPNGRQ